MEATITEIIPDDMPEWATHAFKMGTFFRTAIKKVEEAEEELRKINEWKEILLNEMSALKEENGNLQNNKEIVDFLMLCKVAVGYPQDGSCQAKINDKIYKAPNLLEVIKKAEADII